jgi:hypothetical protein
LLVSGVGQSSATLSWSASTDNVGVTGYRVFADGGLVSTAFSTSFVFGGLSCGVSHSLGVAAVDGAGNVSGTASVSVLTAACSGGGGGGGGSASVFVAQAQAGTGDGSSCANARPVSFFNTASNWGVGKPIAPGVSVGLCGTITTKLTVQGSGSSGSPITIVWQAGARISLPVCGCFNMDGKSFIVLDGGSNGVLESTANGTALANHTGTTAISANPCNNCEVGHLMVGPIYTIASGDSFICASGCSIDNAGVRCLNFSGNNWKIHDNTFHDASWCLVENGDDANTRIYNNNIYNFDHGWVPGGGTAGKLYFYGNHVHDMGVWDNCNSGQRCHHDGIHCYAIPGPDHFIGVYIYDNVFDGTVGGATTSWIYLESNAGSSCADSSSKWYIFNNVFSSSDNVPTNPYVGSTTGSVVTPYSLYNNTFAGPGAGHFGSNGSNCAYASVDFVNNTVGGCAGLGTSGTGTTDFNAFANGSGTNCFSAGCSTAAFSSWQATGKDTHSVYNPAGAVGSNATGIGTNLTNLCNADLTPLCTDINGNPRPTTGPWTAGAYN